MDIIPVMPSSALKSLYSIVLSTNRRIREEMNFFILPLFFYLCLRSGSPGILLYLQSIVLDGQSSLMLGWLVRMVFDDKFYVCLDGELEYCILPCLVLYIIRHTGTKALYSTLLYIYIYIIIFCQIIVLVSHILLFM